MSTARRQPMLETQSEFDLHQLLVPTPTSDAPKTRDSASASSGPSSDAGSFMIPDTLSRSNSVYSFSRASFSSQISSLTSMNLPQPDALLNSINGLPSSRKAIKALNGAAEQIQLWTKKALKVLENLDADEDVEWAAAAGRDGLDETEKTVNKFENLVNVYVVSIEELQSRPDIGEVKPDDLQGVVELMEMVLDAWENVRKSLKKVHQQVELAMEWEELWSTVLQEVGAEMDSLNQLVFEMEEKRHQAYKADDKNIPTQNIDLNELESFIDEPKTKGQSSNPRFSLPPAFEASPLGSPIIDNPTDDSNLLALFARMQPLRASLDFLPMRLSMFQSRAEKIFPEACRELDDKKERLEKNWTDLSEEAENLRRELSEDRWVIVFRNAGRQAQKMCESVERSVVKVQEAINEGYQRTHPSTLAKRVESFEAKKMHYSPAIQRVLGIIQKGLKDRLTVNGEILRLHKDLSARMRDLTDAMDELARLLEPVSSRQNSRLRESISSIVSADRSFSSTTMAGTPGSSPASSIDFPANSSQKPTPKYGLNGYSKPRSASSSRPPPLSSANKRSSLMPRRPGTPLSANSHGGMQRRGVSPAPGPPSIYRQGSYVPPTNSAKRPTPSPVVNKPRWVATVKNEESEASRSASTTSPSLQRKYWTPRSISSTTALPLRSPLGREAASSPLPGSLPSPVTAQKDQQYYRSFAERVADPSPLQPTLLDPVPYHRGRNVSAPHPGTIRSPSSMAVLSTSKAMANAVPRPPSALSRAPRTLPPRLSSLASRQAPPSGTHTHIHSREHSPVQVEDDVEDQENRDYLPPHPALPSSGQRSTHSHTISNTYSHTSSHHTSNHEDDVYDSAQDPGSSPLSRKTITRPGSQTAGSGGRGKRMSMLPVPVGGRTSSMGFRERVGS